MCHRNPAGYQHFKSVPSEAALASNVIAHEAQPSADECLLFSVVISDAQHFCFVPRSNPQTKDNCSEVTIRGNFL